MPRVVLDLNVLVSAVLFPGICRSIVESLEEDRFTMVLSPALLEDLLRTFEKPKLKRLMTPDSTDAIISLVHRKALIIEPKRKVRACRDPGDDAVLEAALAAQASTIVTGDKDLLTMISFRNIQILSPRDFSLKLRIH